MDRPATAVHPLAQTMAPWTEAGYLAGASSRELRSIDDLLEDPTVEAQMLAQCLEELLEAMNAWPAHGPQVVHTRAVEAVASLTEVVDEWEQQGIYRLSTQESMYEAEYCRLVISMLQGSHA